MPEPAVADSAVTVEIRSEVGWIIIRPFEETSAISAVNPKFIGGQAAVGVALDQLRWDKSVRVVVITGEKDGEFWLAPHPKHYDNPAQKDRVNPMRARAGQMAEGRRTPNAIETLAVIEKPVIARLNGDAFGFGQSVLWGCDMIVAREDALVADIHTGMGKVLDHKGELRGIPWAVTPGDGAMAFFPLFLPPTKAKEYLFLSKTYTAKELEELHVFNYAVPLARLDEVTNELIDKLLAIPSSVLARTKRAANKLLVTQWNLVQDLAQAYEVLDLMDHSRAGVMNHD
jgi:enoyl-CoA hydratase